MKIPHWPAQLPLVVGSQVWVSEHNSPIGHVPQDPPQPSAPHSLLVHLGTHSGVLQIETPNCGSTEQTLLSAAQSVSTTAPSTQVFRMLLPTQTPVDGTFPQLLVLLGTQTPAVQVSLPWHVPHKPPQPSSPQFFPLHWGVQQEPSWQLLPKEQMPH